MKTKRKLQMVDRSFKDHLLQEMLADDYLVPIAPEIYEDEGGNLVYERDIDLHMAAYVSNLGKDDIVKIIKRYVNKEDQ